MGQLLLLTLGELAWALVHQDWFLHICKVLYSSQPPPPMLKPQVLTVDHERNYSLPPTSPDFSARHLMPARAGELRKGSLAKQPWAQHARVKVTLTCMHKGSQFPMLVVLSPSSFKSDQKDFLDLTMPAL